MASYYPWNDIIPILVLILIITGMAIFNYYHSNGQTSNNGMKQILIPANTPSALANIPHYCLTQNASNYCNYHWHVHLDIYVNSTSYVAIPNELGHIGNQQYSLYSIHTHDYSGIIHIECCNPHENVTFNLGDIFEVWGYPVLDSTHCLIYSGQAVTVYVDGALMTGDYSNIPLRNHLEIAITIGTIHPSIPSSYNFPAGF